MIESGETSRPNGLARVDMMAEAREAQWDAAALLGAGAIRLVAPAKVNLFLGVGSPRGDGYHDVTTVMHALALHDNLYMSCAGGDEAVVGGDVPGAGGAPATKDAQGAVAMAGPAGSVAVRIEVADKTGACATGGAGLGDAALAGVSAAGVADLPVMDNLAFKAIDALAHEIGYAEPCQIGLRIEKAIPAQAGLGGGSADAAAALVGAAHFWGVEVSGRTLERVASSLGADVAFFLKGGCGLFSGVGERFERLLEPMKGSVLLVRPLAGVSTKEAYAAFDRDPQPVPSELIARANDAVHATEVPLFNNLTSAAESCLPALGETIQWLKAQTGMGEGKVLLSGSGSAVFALCDNADAAMRLAAEAGKRGLWARATTFSSLRATMIG